MSYRIEVNSELHVVDAALDTPLLYVRRTTPAMVLFLLRLRRWQMLLPMLPGADCASCP
jgi:hypothetical protein